MMLQMQKKNSNNNIDDNVIRPKTYEEVKNIIGNPYRDYWILVHLVDNTPRCIHCITTKNSFSLLSKNFTSNINKDINDINNTISDTPIIKHSIDLDQRYTKYLSQLPLFFVEIDVYVNNVIRDFNITYAPLTILYPPTYTSPKISKNDYTILPINKLPKFFNINLLDLTKLSQQITRRCGIQPDSNIGLPLLLLFGLVSFGMIITLFIISYYKTLLQHINKLHSVFIVFSQIFFTFCISGGMYNRIQKTPWYYIDQKTSEISYISNGTNSQMVSETIIIMILVCVFSFSLSYLTYLYWNIYSTTETIFPTSELDSINTISVSNGLNPSKNSSNNDNSNYLKYIFVKSIQCFQAITASYCYIFKIILVKSPTYTF